MSRLRSFVRSMRLFQKRNATRPQRTWRRKRSSPKLMAPWVWNIVCVVFSSTVSACAGILFWHWLLSALPCMDGVDVFLYLRNSVVDCFTGISCRLSSDTNNEDCLFVDCRWNHKTNEAMSEDVEEAIVDAMGKQGRTKVQEFSRV